MKDFLSSDLKITVSPVCTSNKGERFAYVQFEDDNKSAEGKIPECNICINKGFSDKEIELLEEYMRANRTELKKLAAGVNVFNAMRKE